MCIYTVKSVIKYYTHQNSPVYTCFFDASKAFDRISHWTLFKKLIACNTPVLIVRILMFWYQRQSICVKWGKRTSEYLSIINGVRQGGVLSPQLFAIYMDDLSVCLTQCKAGCHLNGGSNYDSLFARTVAFSVQVAYWIIEVIAPCGTSVPCQLRPVVRRPGRGVLWTGGDPCMTGCLECPLASPVLTQSWSQTATDGAWYSTTELLSGRDRPRCLCVLRLSGCEPKTRRTGA